MVFGDDVHAARISSGALDWRLANDMTVEPVALEPAGRPSCGQSWSGWGCGWASSTSRSGPTARSVFLEVNPQGQFLFVEGMSDMPLGDAFAAFAARELGRVAAGAR